jgi:lipoprotein NlpI/transglutaminase-like putative cysteine protease
MLVTRFLKYCLIVLSVSCVSVIQVSAKESRNSEEKKISTNGFSYLIEPLPQWVTAVDRIKKTADTGSSMHYDLVDKQVKVEKDNVTDFTHIIRVIDSSAGLDNGTQIDVSFDPSYQTLVFHQINLTRDGKSINKLTANTIRMMQRETQLEAKMYDGLVTANIVLGDVRVGDKVEYAYSIRGENPVFKGKYSYVDWVPTTIGPIDSYQLRLLSPLDRVFNVKASPEYQVVKALSKNQNEIIVSRKLIPQFNYDQTAPMSAYSNQQIYVSEYNNWGEVANWAANLFNVQPSAEVKIKANEIKSANKNQEEQLLAALNFTQTEIRYLGMEIGPNTHKPHTPEEVMKQRFGDCKDKSLLFVSLLNELGIQAKPILVSTDFKDGVMDFAPNPLAFDHVIAKVDFDHKTYYLDPTRAYQTGALDGRVSTNLGLGLLVDASTQNLTEMPSSFNKKRITVNEHIIVTHFNEEPMMQSTVTYYGDLAEVMRNVIANQPKDKLDSIFESDYLKFYPKIQRQGGIEVIESETENAVSIMQKFKMIGFWTYPEERALYTEIAYWNALLSLNHPNESNRKIPFAISSPGSYVQEVVFDLPEDVLQVESLNRYKENNSVFSYRLDYESTKRQAKFVSNLEFRKDHVSVREWPEFVENTIDARKGLASAFYIPVVSTSRYEKLKEEVTALEKSAKNDKKLTKVQLKAKYKILVLKAQLEGDRLLPSFRAKALQELGISEDNVGQAALAKAHFEQAIKLAPEDASIYTDAAVNAFTLGDDKLAIQYGNKSLELAPSDDGILNTLAYANYYSKRYDQAKQNLADYYKTSDKSRKGYISIWLYLSMLSNGDDADKLIKEYLPSLNESDWPNAILFTLLDTNKYQDTLKQAKDGKQDESKLCELYYYMGEKYLTQGDKVRAKEFFNKSINTGIVEYTEYTMSKRRLSQL